MTASQRPERVGRAALIEAAARALIDSETNGLCGENWPRPCDGCDCFRPDHPNESAALDRSRAENVLDAVLPLIADAIEALPLRETTYPLAAGQVRYNAARLVRSYLDGAPFGRCSRCNRPLPHTEPEQRACAAMETNGEERPEDTARRYARIISQLEDLIAHARLISPSERAVIYVADLERALGIDAPVPHKLGGNGA